MKKLITYENFGNFTYSNDALIQGEIKGIILSFMGLGGATMFESQPRGDALAEKGIVYLIPYLNPWNWMNRRKFLSPFSRCSPFSLRLWLTERKPTSVL